MKTPTFRHLILSGAIAALLGAGGNVYAAFEMGPKACKNAVAERFTQSAMADISVSRPSHKQHSEAMVDWSLTNEDESAMGYCKVNRDGTVLRLKVEHHKRYSHSNNDELDGFFFDRRTGQWRDESGEVCHSCTPENGFPRHGH